MSELSAKAKELLEFFQEDYKEDGYMYSGSWPHECLVERGFGKDVIHELQEAGLIQKRDCEDYAFELTSAERGSLVANHSLCSVWFEKVGKPMLPEIQREVRDVADVVESPFGHGNGLVMVGVVKVEGDTNKPDRIEVPCAFSVGQVVDLEYDLPRKMQVVGYSAVKLRNRKAVGQFMVTNVVRNMVFEPGENMLELQSLCDEFNKLFPAQRTMMVSEEIALKRMRDIPSLENQIKSAEGKVSCVDKDYKGYEIERE